MPREFLHSITITGGQVVGGQFDPLVASDLPASGVTPNSYANPTLTVDAYGRITSIINGSSGFAIGNPITSGRMDGSVLYEDANGKLAISPGQSFFWDEDGSIGPQGLPTVLYIGGPNAGANAALGLWEQDFFDYRYLFFSGGTCAFPGDIEISGGNGGILAGEGVFLNLVSIGGGSDDNLLLAVQAIVLQTQDMFVVRSSVGAIYSRFNKAGYFMTRKVAAPADGDLANSEMAFWLTDTPAGAKFNVKAKDSGGTVVTGSFNLT